MVISMAVAALMINLQAEFNYGDMFVEFKKAANAMKKEAKDSAKDSMVSISEEKEPATTNGKKEKKLLSSEKVTAATVNP